MAAEVMPNYPEPARGEQCSLEIAEIAIFVMQCVVRFGGRQARLNAASSIEAELGSTYRVPLLWAKAMIGLETQERYRGPISVATHTPSGVIDYQNEEAIVDMLAEVIVDERERRADVQENVNLSGGRKKRSKLTPMKPRELMRALERAGGGQVHGTKHHRFGFPSGKQTGHSWNHREFGPGFISMLARQIGVSPEELNRKKRRKKS